MEEFDLLAYDARNLFEKILAANKKVPRFSLLLTPEGISVMFEDRGGEKRYIGSIIRMTREASARKYISAISDEIDEILEEEDW